MMHNSIYWSQEKVWGNSTALTHSTKDFKPEPEHTPSTRTQLHVYAYTACMKPTDQYLRIEF